MIPVLAKRHAARLYTTGLSRGRPQMQLLIEGHCQHVVSKATAGCIVRLLTEVIESNHGRSLDSASGLGGMFAQSARFVAKNTKNPAAEPSIHGVEKTDEIGRLCRLNLAVHSLEGDIRHGGNVNSYHDDPHDATGRFDFVLANPPFNVNAVDKERLKDMVGANRRFPFGLPLTDDATAVHANTKTTLAKPERRSVGKVELHYLWIQLFHSALNEKGRAGFVIANSARIAHSRSMEITEEVRKYVAEQGMAEKEAREKGMEAKSKEFVEKGVEVYAKA